MAKRERLEDLGKLNVMLKNIAEMEIFENTHSKHGYEVWVNTNHDMIDYDNQIRGLNHIFQQIRHLNDLISECYDITCGDDDDECEH